MCADIVDKAFAATPVKSREDVRAKPAYLPVNAAVEILSPPDTLLKSYEFGTGDNPTFIGNAFRYGR